MTASKFLPLRLLVVLVALLLLAVPCREAAALSQIRHEVWTYRGDVPLVPQSSVVAVSFYANTADMDLPSRVVFSVVVVDAAGTKQPLLQYRWGSWEEIAGPGTPLNVFASFRLSCDGEGNLVAEPVETWFGFCNRGQVALDVRNFQNVQIFPVHVSARFGLQLMDRGGLYGAEPTPSDAFGCSAAAAGGLDAATARVEMSDLKSRQANLIANGRTGSIGLYFDMFGRNCSGTILPDQPDTVYVVAKMEGMSECGIAGAEFLFTGVPASWSTFPVAAPDILAIGDPLGRDPAFDTQGVTVGFECKREEAAGVVLYSVLVLASEEERNLEFHIENRTPPTNPDFSCPLLVLCDYPAFTKICVEGLPCTINATSPKLCPGTTPVTLSTWGQVKALFR